MTKNKLELKDISLAFDRKKADYQIDALQNEILKFYIRADHKFRRAFNQDYTNFFVQYLKDKARLREPVHLAIRGVTRCQPKGSKVLMANGEWKNIEDIKIGDRVISPQKSRKNISSKVLNTFFYKNQNIFSVNDSNNKILYKCSENHFIPIFHSILSFSDVEARELNRNKTYLSFLFKNLQEMFFPINVKIKSEKKADVYGFELDNGSHYYITDNYMITKNSGKSYIGVSASVINMLLNNKLFTIDYVCANSYEFLEKLKSMTEEELKDSTFLIDEEKKAVYGAGSIAKKIKLQDVQNIIAKQNISTISLTPDNWANKEANYGLRTFGRCFNTKTVRLMLYNLAESGHASELPMGNVYLPIFTQLLPKWYAESLEKAYLEKKDEWIKGEMRGEGDVLAEIKKKTAQAFMRDENLKKLKTKDEKMTYISTKLGSEWVKNEITEIFNLIKIMERGIDIE